MYAADIHIHSKYSRATSGECVPAMLEMWARRKGIALLGTGDFTHPAWRQMLRDQLEEAEGGLYRLKRDFAAPDAFAPPDAQDTRFVISGEISSIYKQNGRVRKVHSVLLLPSLEDADALARRLEAIGNVHSDGRPILGLSAHDLLEITLETCPGAMFIPAHIWTPHFSLFGAFSGFDTIEECFGDLTEHIHALETGLSSDPVMNRRLSALDRYTLVSNSDAHSPQKLGRELNLIGGEPSYEGLKRAVEGGGEGGFLGTAEFFPEEGKYHFDGHRNCGVCLEPDEAERLGNICPVCGRRMTMGVYHRVAQLADRSEEAAEKLLPLPFERLVPLAELIASVSGVSAASQKAQARYEALIHALGSEMDILRTLPAEEIEKTAGRAIAEGIRRMRAGEIQLSPGFDGEYGKVQLMTADEIAALSGQMTFLHALLPEKPKRRAAKSEAEGAPAPVKTVSAAPSASAGLNPDQQAAVEAEEACVAVVAGPGSGKTRTLVARIAHLLERGERPDSICAVTFTNKAAQELKERLSQRFGNRRAIQGMTIGTFHSIALQLLRRSRPGLTVLDGAGALSLAGDIVGALALNMTAQKFLREIDRMRAGEEHALPEEAVSLWRSRLKELDAATFDDLIDEALSDPLPAPFRHLLADEYQDVNGAQRELVRKWSAGDGTLFVIGDPDQSIYGFRGADADCFDLLQAEKPGMRRIVLRDNYRSAPEILGCALSLIEKNGGKRDLRAGRAPGGKVRSMSVPDEYAEAITVAKEIGRMVGGMDMLEAQTGAERHVGFSDIAVLYRTHRQAEVIEKALATEGIPYTVAGQEEYLADPESAKAIAFLKLVINPSDRAALHALAPEIRTAETDAEEICAQLDAAGGNAAEIANLLRAAAGKARKEKPKKLLERWKKAMLPGRNEAVERLISAASAAPDTQSFLNDVTLGAEGDVMRSGGKTYQADAVRLTTLHGSKGLEYPVVFIAGVKKDVIPLAVPYGRPTDLSEERRLLYVGMTRAKDELILMTHPDESPFLRDVPAESMLHEQSAYQKRLDAGRQMSFL